MVNKILSSILRRTFLDLWVSPSWRTNFLPLLEPSREDILARQEMDKQLNVALKISKATIIANKATALWESTAPLLKRSSGKYRDGLSDILFDTNAIIPFYDILRLPLYKDPLLEQFMGLVNEPADTRSTKQKITDKIRPPPTATAEDFEDSGEETGDIQNCWKIVRKSGGIQIHRKRTVAPDQEGVSEYLRGVIPVNCDAVRVFGILSNPKHFMHIYDSFVGCKTLVDCIFKLTSEWMYHQSVYF
jgi:hypothetical protein